jgi:hypothetical protein
MILGIFFWVPVSIFAAIILVLVARFDESFKPCPISYYVKSNSKTRISGWTTFTTFCGPSQSHNVLPRAVLSELHDVF